MRSTQSRRSFLKAAAALAASAPPIARAAPRQEAPWPDKPIRMVIPFAAGGTTDLLARAVGQHMSQVWKQPVVADNRPGANGVVAGEIVAKSAGDGYTLSMVAMGHAINPLLYKSLPYDGRADFTPISLMATFPQLVLVHPAVKAATLAELIQLDARARRELGRAQPVLSRAADRRRSGHAGLPVGRLVRAGRAQGHAAGAGGEDRGGGEAGCCDGGGQVGGGAAGRRHGGGHAGGVRGLHRGRAEEVRGDRERCGNGGGTEAKKVAIPSSRGANRTASPSASSWR
jgi:hypothetical protein